MCYAYKAGIACSHCVLLIMSWTLGISNNCDTRVYDKVVTTGLHSAQYISVVAKSSQYTQFHGIVYVHNTIVLKY